MGSGQVTESEVPLRNCQSGDVESMGACARNGGGGQTAG